MMILRGAVPATVVTPTSLAERRPTGNPCGTDSVDSTVDNPVDEGVDNRPSGRRGIPPVTFDSGELCSPTRV